MTLGSVDLGDGIRFQTVLKNLSDEIEDASSLKFSIVDGANTKLINKINTTHITEGTYDVDVYLSNATFSKGLHYAIWTGYSTNGSSNISFVDTNPFYIEENRLV